MSKWPSKVVKRPTCLKLRSVCKARLRVGDVVRLDSLHGLRAHSPDRRAFANWYQVVAPGLYPEEERFLWECVLGGAENVDFASKLGLRSFEEATARARREMDAGYSRDAWYVLRAMQQLAQTPEEKAYAALLMANRAKDLGIFEVGNRFCSPAEEHYNTALSFLNGCQSAEATKLRQKIFVNLAELHFELQRADLAEAIVDKLLKGKNDLLPEVCAHAYFVRGRIQAEQGDKTPAIRNLRRGRKGYKDLGNEHLADWVTMHLAEVQGDKKTLEALVQKYGPGHDLARPDELLDPETFAWSKYHLAMVTGQSDLAKEAKDAAERFGFRHLVLKSLTFLGEHPTVAVTLFALVATAAMLLVDGSTAEVLAKSCN